MQNIGVGLTHTLDVDHPNLHHRYLTLEQPSIRLAEIKSLCALYFVYGWRTFAGKR